MMGRTLRDSKSTQSQRREITSLMRRPVSIATWRDGALDRVDVRTGERLAQAGNLGPGHGSVSRFLPAVLHPAARVAVLFAQPLVFEVPEDPAGQGQYTVPQYGAQRFHHGFDVGALYLVDVQLADGGDEVAGRHLL